MMLAPFTAAEPLRNVESFMNQQILKPREGQDIPDVPPAEHAPQKEEREAPVHDEGLGKPLREPGQHDVGMPEDS